MITDDQLLRYSRQVMLSGWDVAGQEKLLSARVLVIGLGGLGCPVALYLAAAGVGELVLADPDRVELTNLQRQLAHGEEDVGRFKVDSARDSIARVNSETRVRVLPERLDAQALAREIPDVDLVDATDSFLARLAINQACLQAGVPWISGAAIRSEGQVVVFDPRAESACYRCLYPEGSSEENLSCSENGVLAPMVGVIGSLQALEAIKVLADYGKPLVSTLLMIDGWGTQVQRIRLTRDPACPHCSGSERD